MPAGEDEMPGDVEIDGRITVKNRLASRVRGGCNDRIDRVSETIMLLEWSLGWSVSRLKEYHRPTRKGESMTPEVWPVAKPSIKHNVT